MPKISNAKAMNTPLKNAKGLGAAKDGVHHWLMQKVTALANIPLVLWFVFSVIGVYARGASYEAFVAWVAAPWNTVLLIALFVSIFYHAKLGAEVVVEDYVSCKALQKAKLIAFKLVFSLAIIASIVAVLKLSFAG